MKYLRKFETQADYETYMSGENEETVFPNVSIGFGGPVRFHNLLPNIDTTGYATTFENGKSYPREAQLFKSIVSDFIEGDLNDGDAVIWMDLSQGTVDISCYTQRQTFSIADQPLYKNYLSKITNFCNEDGEPESTLNIFPGYVNVSEYVIGPSSYNKEINFNLDNGAYSSVSGEIAEVTVDNYSLGFLYNELGSNFSKTIECTCPSNFRPEVTITGKHKDNFIYRISSESEIDGNYNFSIIVSPNTVNYGTTYRVATLNVKPQLHEGSVPFDGQYKTTSITLTQQYFISSGVSGSTGGYPVS